MLDTRRRRTGALPITAALLAVALGAAVASPTLRHELSLSFQRQPADYVELYLADEAAARGCPVGPDGTLQATVALRSHLAAAVSLPYSVSAVGADGAVRSRSGVVATTPGTTARFAADVAAPATPYTVQIQLTGRSEHLVLHCGGTS